MPGGPRVRPPAVPPLVRLTAAGRPRLTQPGPPPVCDREFGTLACQPLEPIPRPHPPVNRPAI